ncbi:Imm50 family immunity protein [Hymenobacter terricola]|uniref:Imm50 family immunity protein n=1 Tax=Hymenobacter terricola TaxID=2819236 RepID=UPI001B30ED2C|nr:Imm50 family immunity protein [Hymenobacter terricola]
MEIAGIENQELVIAHFGQWPAFHDAEIVSILFERAEQGYWPVISLKIYTVGGFDRKTSTAAKHCLIELLFAGVQDHELAGFNHQNVVFSIDFTKVGNLIMCDIEPCYGVSGYIAAERVVVESVSLLDGNPRPLL